MKCQKLGNYTAQYKSGVKVVYWMVYSLLSIFNSFKQHWLFNKSFFNPDKLRETVTSLGTHLFIRNNVNIRTMLLICVGNHYRVRRCLKVFNLMINH